MPESAYIHILVADYIKMADPIEILIGQSWTMDIDRRVVWYADTDFFDSNVLVRLSDRLTPCIATFHWTDGQNRWFNMHAHVG